MTTASFWLLIVLAGLGTLVIRLAPVIAHGRVPTPPLVTRLLAFVPPAAMAALIVPGALYVKTAAGYDVSPARIVAAAVALAVALRWRNVLLTLAAGMLTLWVLAALLG